MRLLALHDPPSVPEEQLRIAASLTAKKRKRQSQIQKTYLPREARTIVPAGVAHGTHARILWNTLR